MIKKRSQHIGRISLNPLLYALLALGMLALVVILRPYLLQVVPMLEQNTAMQADQPALTHAWAADAARWQARADDYLSKNQNNYAPLQQTTLTRGQMADAARWTAVAIANGKWPGHISGDIAKMIGREELVRP